MVSRRQQSSVSEETPVRFYKMIALSFLGLTVVLLALVVFMSSKRATIVITTKPEPVESSQDIDVGRDGGSDIGGAVTSTSITVTRRFQPSGGREEPGVATGTVTIHNETGASQALVATTRLLASGGELFRLKDRVAVPANGTVIASVYADSIGSGAGLQPTRFTIPGLRPEKQAVIYAESTSPMTSATRHIAVLSQEDADKAVKTVEAALLEEGGTALQKVFPGKEGVFSVMQHSTESDTVVGKEVSEFTVKGKGTIVGIFYDAEKVRAMAMQSILKKGVSDTEIVEPSKEPPSVAFRDYDSVAHVGAITVVGSGRAVLNPESKQIQKEMFFGKGKDEVRRYLLSLKHVNTVEVQFRPVWMLSVPGVPDHVQVIVKNVE